MKKNHKIIIIVGFFAILLVYFFILSAPLGFNRDTVVSVEQGTGLGTIAHKLKEAKVIRSTEVFKIFVVLFGDEKHLIPTNYLFENKEAVYTVARRIIKGEHGFSVAKITVPEGFSNLEIADVMAPELPYFNKENFLSLAKDKEGYLFPDTYFFTRDSNELQVIKTMNENFKKRISKVEVQITASGKSEKSILIMASIIEREAKGDEDRKFISGILWKRLSISMPLQADAAPVTYDAPGLPQAPIANPGLEALDAALNPTQSNYLYYLHDKDGNIHYARSFDEHKANKERYLSN